MTITTTRARRNVPTEDGLHPAVYQALIGLLVWTAAVVGVLFGMLGDAYLNLQLAVAAFLCAMFVAVPLYLRTLSGAKPMRQSFREWASHELQTADGPVEAKHAAIMVLLAPAAVALGLTGTSAIAYMAAIGAL